MYSCMLIIIQKLNLKLSYLKLTVKSNYYFRNFKDQSINNMFVSQQLILVVKLMNKAIKASKRIFSSRIEMLFIFNVRSICRKYRNFLVNGKIFAIAHLFFTSPQ